MTRKKHVCYSSVTELVEPARDEILACPSNQEEKSNLEKRWSELRKKPAGTANPAVHWLRALAKYENKDLIEVVQQCWKDQVSQDAAMAANAEIEEKQRSNVLPTSEGSASIGSPSRSEKELLGATSISLYSAASSLLLGVGLLLGWGTSSLFSPEKNSAPIEAERISNSGYHENQYHKQAPTEIVLNVEPPKDSIHKDSGHGVFRYEASPQEYQLTVGFDKHKLLDIEDHVVLIFNGGDRGVFDPIVGGRVTKPAHVIRFGDKKSWSFSLSPGTSKVSMMVAKNQDERFTKIEGTHSVCIFYCYPDLTIEGATLNRSSVVPNEKVAIQLEVVNHGTGRSQNGNVAVLLQTEDKLEPPMNVATVSFHELDPGKSQKLSVKFTVPDLGSDLLLGRLHVDCNNETTERDELFAGKWDTHRGRAFRPKNTDKLVVPPNNFATFQLRVGQKPTDK